MISDFFKDKKTRLVFISSFLWAVAAHGMAMFNKYSFHDDVSWFNGVGETYGLGRWFLGFTGSMTEYLCMSRNYSTPLFNGILTILGVAVMVYLVCRKLRIDDPFMIIGLSGVMVCFPAVTNIFGFIFTGPHYYLGAALGVVGAYVFSTNKNIASFILCTFLMCLSTGLYQSNIAINLIVLLLFMLDEVYEHDMTWKEYIVLGLKNAAVCAAFMAEYFGLNALFLKITGLEMYNYKGVNSFGMTGISGYAWRIFTAYKRFIKPADFINYDGVSANMFPWNLKYLHIFLVIISIVLIFVMLRRAGKFAKIVQMGILIAVSPLFSYFIYFMVAEEDAHGGMAYGEVFMFALAAFVITRLREDGYGSSELPNPVKNISMIISRIAVVIIMIMAVMFTRYANVCYLKVELMQSEAISYYTTLITRIQQTEGYDYDTPICFVGGEKKNDEAFSGNKRFDPIYLPPYQGNSIINDFEWEETMKMWCGFSYEVYHGQHLDETKVQAMPIYPADGSVRMINGVLVVKFNEEN